MLCLLQPFFFIHQLTITFTINNRKLTLLRKFWSCFKRTVFVHVDFWSLFFVFLQWQQSNSRVPIPQYLIRWHARMNCGVFTLIYVRCSNYSSFCGANKIYVITIYKLRWKCTTYSKVWLVPIKQMKEIKTAHITT